MLKGAFKNNGLFSRESGILPVETFEGQYIVGFVRYSMLAIPDSDHLYPEIGFGIPDIRARRKEYSAEGVELMVAYLFAGYPAERIAAFTDIENTPAQRVMEKLGFHREGIIRKGLFRDGQWRDIAMYGILRGEFVNASDKICVAIQIDPGFIQENDLQANCVEVGLSANCFGFWGCSFIALHEPVFPR